MFHMSGMGGSEFRTNGFLGFELTNDVVLSQLVQAHSDTESIRQMAERLSGYRQRPTDKESVAKFELHRESGLIELMIYDAQTGQVEAKLSPEDLVEGLRSLEQTGDNDAPLSSFFIDISI